MSLTRQLIRLIRAKEVTGRDREAAALLVLDDTVACAIGALPAPPAAMLGAVAPPSSIDPGRRAFYLAGLAHTLEMDDLHRGSVTHPGCVVIPAAWALAEERSLGGHAFLAAVLAGYEACCRIGLSVGADHYRVWHNTATCGPFGSAMAAAFILGLDEEATVSALGNAGTQASGLWEFLETGAMSKLLHTARAAEAGLVAALLAEAGFTGAERILEGGRGFYAGLCPNPSPDAVLASPGRPWELVRTSIKPWPCCRHMHPAIDAALSLSGRFLNGATARITVGTYRAALDVCDRPCPADPYSARFSLQHGVAAALAHGAIDRRSFEPEAIGALASLRARVELALEPALDAAYPAAWGAEVTALTGGGQRITARREAARGDPENPVDAGGIVAKARGLLGDAGMGGSEADRLIDATLALSSDAPIRGLALGRTLELLRLRRGA